jgi:hypothetical protein
MTMMVGKPICGNARKGAVKKRSQRSTKVIGKVGRADPRKFDFSIGDRVEMSALGASRCPRRANQKGTVVGRSIYVNSVGVLFDGNKSSSTVHCDYLEAILRDTAE